MKAIDTLIKYSTYFLVFFFPLFFLPWTISPVNINKQMLVSAFVFFLAFLWLIKIISRGRIRLKWNPLSASVLIFLIVAGLAALLSVSKAQSFWGMNFEPNTFFAFLLCGLGFFIFSNLVKRDRILPVVYSFLLGLSFLAALFLIQTFIKPIFPWDFAKESGFNPAGTVQSLAILFGVGLTMLLGLEVLGNKENKNKKSLALSATAGILLFACVLLINFWLVWLMIALNTVLIIWLMLKKSSDSINPKRFIIPFIVLGLCLLFLFIKIPFNRMVKMPSELSLNYKTSLGISLKTVQSGHKNLWSKNFVLGSGPATFIYDYDLYRPASINSSPFWKARFGQANSFLLTMLAETGILGLFSLIALMLSFLWLFYRSRRQEEGSGCRWALFIAGLGFFLSWTFYSINFTLLFSAFLVLGLFNASSGQAKEIVFIKQVQAAFFFMLVCIFLIVFIGVGYYKLGRMYLGALNYGWSMQNRSLSGSGVGLENKIKLLEKAVKFDQKDIYFQGLSRLLLLRLKNILQNQGIEVVKERFFSNLVLSTEAVAKKAVQINPANSRNWINQGLVYENFINLGVKTAGGLAVESYQKARKLAPRDAQIPFYLARTYWLAAKKTGPKSRAYQQFLEKARRETEASLKLKNNFGPAVELKSRIKKMK